MRYSWYIWDNVQLVDHHNILVDQVLLTRSTSIANDESMVGLKYGEFGNLCYFGQAKIRLIFLHTCNSLLLL